MSCLSFCFGGKAEGEAKAAAGATADAGTGSAAAAAGSMAETGGEGGCAAEATQAEQPRGADAPNPDAAAAAPQALPDPALEPRKPEDQMKADTAEQILQPSGSNGKAGTHIEGASTDTGDASGDSGSKSERCEDDAAGRSHVHGNTGNVAVAVEAVEAMEVEAAPPSDTSFPAYAAKSIVGHRFGMEDTYAVIPNVVSVPKAWVRDVLLDQLPEQAAACSKAWANTGELKGVSSRDLEDGRYALHLFAVYDGHGGASVAEHCSKHLHEQLQRIVGLHADERKRQDTAILSSQDVILEHRPSVPAAGAADAAAAQEPGGKPDEAKEAEQEPEPEPELIQMALTQAFLATDKELEQKQGATDMGTTAVVSLLGRRHLWVANAGDSRAVVARRSGALTLSSDHKANRKDEAVRVEKAGGFIWWNRVMGELAISRAIGDHKLRPYVIADPEITRLMRSRDDQLLLLASDGLWDVISSDDACKIAISKFESELQASKTVKEALSTVASVLTKMALSRGSHDNITVVVVDMRSYPAA